MSRSSAKDLEESFKWCPVKGGAEQPLGAICTVLRAADRFALVPLGHFATITLNFNDKGGETEVCLEGKGIPASEEERTKQGWQRYYFEGIKQTFGYGARLF